MNYFIIILTIVNNKISALSFNQLQFCPTATWNTSGITFAHQNIVGQEPRGFFVNTNNTVYVPHRQNNQILVWFNNSINPTKIISGNFSDSSSIFVTSNGDIYIDNGSKNRRVDKWISNTNTFATVMNVNSPCFGLFVDINDTVYCSMADHYQVIKRWLNDSVTTSTIAAGTGTPGSGPNELKKPHGIFVDVNFDLYVADCENDRIQLFRIGGSQDGITVAGSKSSNTTISLRGPREITLDAQKYLFIVDRDNHRIVGSGPNGFRCLVGCNGGGSQCNQLNHPITLHFDSSGNMFVTDRDNHRIQKYLFLETSCETTTTETTTKSASTVDPITSTLINSLSATTMETTLVETTSSKATSVLSTSTETITTTTASPLFFVPETCSATINSSACTMLKAPCNFSQPCRNGGTCQNNITSSYGYYCLCPHDVDGILCQFNHRPCEPNPCKNGGECNRLSNGQFNCTCEEGLEGSHCQTKTNYCKRDTCQNKGVCRPSFKNYTCECLGDNYYFGRHCENISPRIQIYKTVSKSFAFVAIIALISAAMFFVIMDILKYCFGIDPVNEDRERIRRNKQAKKRKPVIQRFVYVNAVPSLEERISAIKKTVV